MEKVTMNHSLVMIFYHTAREANNIKYGIIDDVLSNSYNEFIVHRNHRMTVYNMMIPFFISYHYKVDLYKDDYSNITIDKNDYNRLIDSLKL